MYANQVFMPQHFGPALNIDYSITADSIEYAEDSFVDAKERLLDVRNWKRYCGKAGVSFVLKDSHGREVHRKAHRGDHVMLDMPGSEKGHLCMIIDALEYDDYPDLSMETFTMRIKPCAHTTGDDEEEKNAEGILMIERRNKHLYATFHRRGNSEPEGDGEVFGLADTEWGSLLRRFVD